MSQLHRWRRGLVFSNALFILVFAMLCLLFPEPVWAFLGVSETGGPLPRLLAWYLGMFGVGGLWVSRAPEKQPVVVMLIGIEKIGAATAFGAHQLVRFNLPLTLIGAFDGVMAIVFVAYATWLMRGSGAEPREPLSPRP